MYYENRKSKNFTAFFVFTIILLSFIVALLFSIYIKDENKIQTDYEVAKTSTEVEKNDEDKIKEIIEKSVKCVVGISKLENSGITIFAQNGVELLGLGSGIVLTADGYILTNEHVSGTKYSNCYVTTWEGKDYTGKVVWSDSNIDLAIVKVEGFYMNYLELGDSDDIYLGQEVYAIGNPVGFEFQRTVTKGIISGINRTIKIEDENNSSYMEDLIQTDATINEGNSGGALIDTEGKLIGVNSIKISTAENMGFAVPINLVKPILEKLVKNDNFEEAYLGIYGYDKEVINYLEEKIEIEEGIYVAKVLSDSPLISLGIQEGDIILKIDDVKIEKMNDLKKNIYEKNPSDKVKLLINRKGLEFEIEVTLSRKIN